MKKTASSLIGKELRVMADSAILVDYYNEELLNGKNFDHNNTQD